MGNMELEVKVLEIDKDKLINKIISAGGEFVSEEEQHFYTYDLPTIYGRYNDLLLQLNEPENSIKYDVAIDKLKLLFFEIDNLLDNELKEDLHKIIGKYSLEDILNSPNLLEILNDSRLKSFISKFRNNENKWIRLRTSNNKTTLTVKHILAPQKDTILQQMKETEMVVPSREQANDFLEAIGLSHKGYLEKKRTTYMLKNHLIEIDTWPKIPTYFELEGKNENDIEEILQLLGYSMKDKNVVSCVVDEVYQMYGYPKTTEFKELKF